eukprot:4839400-Lingulodinium_polyedra.AAC.1
MPCHATPRHATPRHAMPRRAQPRASMPRQLAAAGAGRRALTAARTSWHGCPGLCNLASACWP